MDSAPGARTPPPLPRPRGIDRAAILGAVRRNWLNSILLAVALAIIGMVVAYAFGWALDIYLANDAAPAGKEPGLFAFSSIGLAAALAAALFSAVMAGRAMMYGDLVLNRIVGAREVSERDAPKLHAAAAKVAAAAGIIKPRLVVIESKALNAFAAGRDELHATVGVTRGLLDALEPHELEGVLGHEMGHVLNRDVLYADVVAICVGLTVFLRDAALNILRAGFSGKSSSSSSSKDKKDGGGAVIVALIVMVAVALVAPLFARLVQMAISRQREFGADAAGAFLAGSPEGLISALRKIEGCQEKLKVSAAVQHVFIVNPLKTFKETSSALMATHPATAQRIERLAALAA